MNGGAQAAGRSRAKWRAAALGAAFLAGLSLAGCADWRAPATFPESAAHQTLIEEQALVGLDARGDALVAQLLLGDGRAPELALLAFDRDAGPTRRLALADGEVARAVVARLTRDGLRPEPLLAAAAGALWPGLAQRIDQLGFSLAAPSPPDPGSRRWAARGAGGLPLTLRIASPSSGPPAELLVLAQAPGNASDSDELELARMPLAGSEVQAQVWLAGDVAWMLAGSTALREGALHRAVGLRRASLSRGEAMLHNTHGLADYSAGQLDAARREFERALLADPRYVDALYNAASIAALEDRPDEAVALLRRAAEEDPRRVQVLGRDDDDLRALRQRPDVRELLGLARMPPGE